MHHAPRPPPLPLPSVADRREAGHAVRQRLPRSALGAWSAPAGRRDPVELVLDADVGRIPALLPERYRRMAADPFGFLRGALAVMAADLGGQPNTGLRAQCAGDAHPLNFGAYAGPDGAAAFDLVDFDETLPAPFEWDVKRLCVGLAVAAGVRGATAKAARALAKRAAHAYRRHVHDLALVAPLDAWASRIDLEAALEDIGDRAMRKQERHRLHDAVAASRDQYAGLLADGGAQLARRDDLPRLPAHEATARAAFDAYADSLPEERRVLLARYRLRDVAFKAVGIGSRGTLCAIGLFASADGDPLLLQLKQAQRAALAPYAGDSGYAHQGQRVVVGQRMMQAASDGFLGWASAPDGRDFYVRHLRDPRLIEAQRGLEADLWFYAKLCGRTLARAHARTGDAAAIAGYVGDGEAFDDALSAFAADYAGQVAADHALWREAVAERRVPAA